MDTTATLRRRIELAKELRSVTGTMKSLAAVTIRQYERSMHALHLYVRTVELGLQVLLRAHPELVGHADPLAADAPMLIVVLGSARGLCGPVNRHVAHRARDVADSVRTDPAGPPPTVVASGARMSLELEGVGLRAHEILEAPASAEGIGRCVDDLLVVLDDRRIAAEAAGRVVVVHPRPRAGGQQYEPVAARLLPLDVDRLAMLSAEPWPTRMLPTWWGDWRQTFAALTHELLFVDLHRAHAETQVCVNRARLAAMQAAEESIGERLEELSTRFHRQRQAAITGELLDVISGFEAATG